MMRPVLGLRDKGIERLVSGLPIEGSELDTARRWAVAITRSVSKWEIERGQRRAAERKAMGARA